MNSSPFKVVWVEAAIAFLIPALTVLDAGFGPFALSGTAPNWWAVLIVVGSAMVAGLSGLKSFLSTAYADHKSAQLDSAPVNERETPPAGASAK